MERRNIIIKIVLGVIAGLIVAGIVRIFTSAVAPQVYAIQIVSINEGKKVSIDSKTMQEKPNQDGVMFIYVTGSAKEYDGKAVVEVQAKDLPNWFKQDDAQVINGRYVAKIQLGAKEWPIRGGEGYILRVSAGDDSAKATISVTQEKKGTP